ncbi:MAG: hypothetical protein N2510_04705 [Ignavibacteria bacterium]|nr:hypothetical protein [Ignavibacteria bacterium]
MKYYLFLIQLWILIFISLAGCRQGESVNEPPPPQAFPLFSKTFGTSRSELVTSAVKLNDGSVILTGFTIESAFGDNDIFVVKFNASGDLLWAKLYGGTGNDLVFSSDLCFDGGIIMGGATNSYSGNFDPLVIKLDQEGNIQWNRYYAWQQDDYGINIIQTSDYGYIMTGYTRSYGQGENDVFCLKLNQTGGVMFARCYGGPLNDYGNVIREITFNQSYIIGGYTFSYGVFGDAYVIKLYGDGNAEWARAYGAGGLDAISDMIVNNYTNTYTALGSSTSISFADEDALIMDINTSANLNWVKIYQGSANQPDLFSSILPTQEGLIVTGAVGNLSSRDIIIARMDYFGNVISSSVIGGSGEETAVKILPMTTGGFCVAGITSSYGAGDNDIYITRFRNDGTYCGQSSNVNLTGLSQVFNVIEPKQNVFLINNYFLNIAQIGIAVFNIYSNTICISE